MGGVRKSWSVPVVAVDYGKGRGVSVGPSAPDSKRVRALSVVLYEGPSCRCLRRTRKGTSGLWCRRDLEGP